MKRDLNQLTNKIFEILVVGGGIYGAFVAWDAALRGFSVALIEKGDFGSATSSNSLKIIHGGLRYLQNGSIRLVRTMAYERKTWMRIAPHLVHPLPCLMPTSHKLTQHKLALSAALAVNELTSRNGSPLLDAQKHLPAGRIVSREECLHRLPGLDPKGVTGGAFWHDAQMYSSERLLLSVLLSAAGMGAEIANYVQGIRFLVKGRTIIGMEAEDTMTGQRFEIQAGMVVNATGGWAASLLSSLNPRSIPPDSPLSTAMNLVTRQILPDVAVGFPSCYTSGDKNGNPITRNRVLFVTPWHQYSLIGTIHVPYQGHPKDFFVREVDVQSFLQEINAAYPGAQLSWEDVYHVHAGFLPVDAKRFPDIRLVRENRIIDHQQGDGIEGVVSVIGVKYTTARYGAQETVNLVSKKMGQDRECKTHNTPLFGGQIDYFNDLLHQVIRDRPDGLEIESARHLAYHYGSEISQILLSLVEHPQWARTLTDKSPTIQAEVIHAIRVEMALKLSDVIRRRTELGAAGLPDTDCIKTCADLMASELGWSEARKREEIEDVLTDSPLTATRFAKS